MVSSKKTKSSNSETRADEGLLPDVDVVDVKKAVRPRKKIASFAFKCLEPSAAKNLRQPASTFVVMCDTKEKKGNEKEQSPRARTA